MAGTFERATNADIIALMRANPLAWVVSSGEGGFAATPLPLLAETDESGAVVRLVGHMARSNPQVPVLEAVPRALILFQGPQGYISPSWMPDRTWAPTWNYAVVRIEAEVRFLPGEADDALNRLVAFMEEGRPGAWSAAEMGPRYERIKSGIIAFHAEVHSVRPRFKLGQDERDEIFAASLPHIHDASLQQWMRRFNPGRG